MPQKTYKQIMYKAKSIRRYYFRENDCQFEDKVTKIYQGTSTDEQIKKLRENLGELNRGTRRKRQLAALKRKKLLKKKTI